MPILYSNAIKVARTNVVISALGASAVLVIGDNTLAGGSTGVLASLPFDNPAFTNSAGTMTMVNPPRNAAATGAGLASKAELRDGAGVVIANGLTVGTPGSGPGGTNPDVVINAVSVSIGQAVQATVGTITPTS